MERASLLCVGDVHLGRRPARVPPDLEGLDPRSLGPRAALEAVVDEALARSVRAVVFLGDVVDDEDHFLEAWSALEAAVRRLVRAGVEVLAVAGNHDVKVLPRLADSVQGFRLIGRGGRWESLVLQEGGRPLVRLVGWSFARAEQRESPLGSFPSLPRSDVATIGLLHCDLDAHGGYHAPVARRELDSAPCDAWLLGHIHAPSHETLRAERPIGYLGSLSGLDPTETGAHGPWLVRLDGRRAMLEQLPLAPLAWERIDLDVGGLKDPQELDSALVAALRARSEEREPSLGAALAVGCRVRLCGQHARHREIDARARWLDRDDQRGALRPRFGQRAWFVERIESAARAALDLVAIARGADPPGLLARRLLAVRAGDEEGRKLVHEARWRLATLADQHPWSALDAAPIDEGAARAVLERAGARALEALLSQRGGGA